MPNPSTLEAAEPVRVSGDTPAHRAPEPPRCWKDARLVGPECGIVAELRAEVARLHAMNAGLAERVAAQKELLERRAERTLREPDAMAVVAAAEKARPA